MPQLRNREQCEEHEVVGPRELFSIDELNCMLQYFPENELLEEWKSMFNFSSEVAFNIIREAVDVHYLDPLTERVFTISYACLIILGVIGNTTLWHVIWRKKTLRTARNLYIINLTLSDLTMCLVCMPFTLFGLLNKDWTLGNLLCKLVPVVQCTNILVSTGTIVAIAADRYLTIVRNGLSNRTKTTVSLCILGIWILSFSFTIPLYFFYYVKKLTIGKLLLYRRCVTVWPGNHGIDIYFISLLVIQYIMPSLVLSLVHISIKRHLSRHHGQMERDDRRAQREIKRNRKTTLLLSLIAVFFAASWLPWHVVNLLADFKYTKFKDPHFLYVMLGSCHIVAMSSACFNPILYGWFNTNLRRELLEYFRGIFNVVRRVFPSSRSDRGSSETNVSSDKETRQGESNTLAVFQGEDRITTQTGEDESET